MISHQQTKFIELRAKGFSLTQIATELSVSKRTLVNWGHKLQAELQEEHLLEQEAFREQLIGFREERLRRQAELLARVEAELQKRSLADLSTARLFTMAESLRRQILKETTTKLPAMPAPDEQAVESETDESLLPLAQSALMPINSQPETINDLLPEDRCKTGATLVQISNNLIPSPPPEDEGSKREEAVDATDVHQLTARENQPLVLTEPEYLYACPTDPELIPQSVEDHKHLNRGHGAHLTLPGFPPVHKHPKHSPPAPLLEERVPGAGEGGIKPIPTRVQEQRQEEEVLSNKQVSPAQSASMPINHQQITINPLPDVQPLFKHRVLTEDLGRELRLHYTRAK